MNESDSVPTPARIGPCPVCGTPFDLDDRASCAGCRIDLANDLVDEIHALDLQWNEQRVAFAERRNDLVARLTATRPPPPPPVSPPAALPQPVGDPAPAQLPAPSSTTPGMAVLLAIGGVTLLATAALVFTAVVWSELAPAAQAAVLLAAAALSTVAALILQRRHLSAASGALGVTAVIFVGVDVGAAARFGLLPLGEFGTTTAAVIAALFGLVLARSRVPWVATAAAIAGTIAMFAGTAASLSPIDGRPAVAALITAAWALALAATMPVWPTRPARSVALTASAFWLAIAGVVALVTLGDASEPLGATVAATIVPIAAFVVAGARWRTPLLAPASLLVSAVPAAILVRVDQIGFRVALATAVLAIAVAYATSSIDQVRRNAIRIGIAPAAAFVAGACLFAAMFAITRVFDTLDGVDTALLDPWAAATVAVSLTALVVRASSPTARSWITLPAVLIVSAAVPAAVAWPMLAALAVVAVAVRSIVRPEPFAVLIIATAAVGWATDASWSIATTSAIAAAVGFWTAPELAARPARIMAAFSATLTGLAFGAFAHTVTPVIDIALGVGLAAVFVAGLAAWWLGVDRPPTAVAMVAAVATLAVPPATSGPNAGGVLLLLAAGGWVGFAIARQRGARWVAALAGTVGASVLMAEAGVETVEAYTVTAAALLASAGIWWLAEDRRVRTFTALWPAVSIGLVPSILVLAADPSDTLRTVSLIVVAGALAGTGLATRWLAPMLAGAVTAIAVALIQLASLVGQLPRWVAFAAVGVLLVALAASYERQRQRLRALSARLADFH